MESPGSNEAPAVRDYTEFERAVGAWHEYHRTTPAIGTLDRSLQPRLAPPAYTATTFRPITSSTHRLWGVLAELSPSAIEIHLKTTISRCAAASKAMEQAITRLEITTHMFLAKHRLESTRDRVAYLDALGQAQTAGQAVFVPQQAYRDAITTLYVLAIDVINLLSGKKALKDAQKVKYYAIVESAQMDEEDVRTIFRELTGMKSKKSKKNESHPLLTYMETARQRWENWVVEEGRLKVLVEESLDALL